MNEKTPDRSDDQGLKTRSRQANFSPKTTNNQVVKAALEYAAKGRAVFPCDPKTKAPLTAAGFKAATTDPEQIKQWWHQHPAAMIGSPTGNGTFVLDVDLPHGPAALAALVAKHGPLPETREQLTPSGGRHLFFTGTLKNSAGKIGPGLDIRGAGGYVVLAPSINADGNSYKWTTKATPAESSWLADAVQESTTKPTPTKKTGDGRPGDDFNERGNIRPIIERHGWQFFRNAGAFERWTRPGKESGASATIYDDGSLYVFSPNAPPFESDRRYSPFAVLALLDHGGDYQAAAAALRREGYCGEQQPEQPKQKTTAVDLADFLAMKIPARRNLIAPILPEQGLMMLYARTGVGKTHVTLGMAAALTRGGKFLNWEAPTPAGVLYIDGEMPASDLQARLAAIVVAEGPPVAPFRILTPDLNPEGMPKIDTPAGQAEIERHMTPDIKLIVVDNISTLSSANENEADAWQPVQDWALKQRAAGRSVILVHHAGKGGAQRGTSKREDPLDTVIVLKRPPGYSQEQGACFEIRFEKARGLYGKDVQPMEATLTTDPDGIPSWNFRKVDLATREKVVDLVRQDYTQGEVASALGLDKSTVSRHVKKAVKMGELPEQPKAKTYTKRPCNRES